MSVPLLSIDRVAARLNVSVKFVYRHAREIGGVKVGKFWRFDPARVDRYLARQAQQAAAAPEPHNLSVTRAKALARQHQPPARHRVQPELALAGADFFLR